MAERLEVYKCEACGNIVEVLHGGGGELVCCGEAMKLMTENTVDAAKEKHVPAVEKVEGGYKVKVGSTTSSPGPTPRAIKATKSARIELTRRATPGPPPSPSPAR